MLQRRYTHIFYPLVKVDFTQNPRKSSISSAYQFEIENNFIHLDASGLV